MIKKPKDSRTKVFKNQRIQVTKGFKNQRVKNQRFLKAKN